MYKKMIINRLATDSPDGAHQEFDEIRKPVPAPAPVASEPTIRQMAAIVWTNATSDTGDASDTPNFFSCALDYGANESVADQISDICGALYDDLIAGYSPIDIYTFRPLKIGGVVSVVWPKEWPTLG